MKIIYYLFFWIYQLLWIAMLPAAVIRLLLRSRHEIGYRHHLKERVFPIQTFNTSDQSNPTFQQMPLLWLHAVSAGEMMAATPLIQSLSKHKRVLITTTTPTGRFIAMQQFRNTPNLHIQYMPYDWAPLIWAFCAHHKPETLLIMETEVWPSLLEVCCWRKIKAVLVNARLSDRSAFRYSKFEGLGVFLWRRFELVLSQSDRETNHFRRLGAKHVITTGNLKFDITPNANLIRQATTWRSIMPKRPHWIAASTRDGEESIIIEIHEKLMQLAYQNGQICPLLILVPRHPQRFDAVGQLLTHRNLNFKRRTELDENTVSLMNSQTTVLLGNTMGEMSLYYGLADIAVMGGTLLNFGGQNPIEPCAQAIPVIFGEFIFNFQEVYQKIAATQSGVQTNSETIVEVLWHLLNNDEERREMGQHGQKLVQTSTGAVEKTLQYIENIRTL